MGYDSRPSAGDVAWNPDQYLRFAQQRLRPALDLIARIDATPTRVYDLGCGTGNVTRLLCERWPGSQVAGVDESAEMLAQAERDGPRAAWIQQSIVTWKPNRPADLLFSNAALHWLPDHAGLFARLMGYLAPGGILAVQMPRNFSAPSHTLIAATVRAGAWRDKLEDLLGPPPVADPDFYFKVVRPLSVEIDIWETEYLQVLEGQDPVKEWVKGTWLKQFLERLSAGERAEFEIDYARRLRAAYPPSIDGTTLFPFRRLFIVAKSLTT